MDLLPAGLTSRRPNTERLTHTSAIERGSFRRAESPPESRRRRLRPKSSQSKTRPTGRNRHPKARQPEHSGLQDGGATLRSMAQEVRELRDTASLQLELDQEAQGNFAELTQQILSLRTEVRALQGKVTADGVNAQTNANEGSDIDSSTVGQQPGLPAHARLSEPHSTTVLQHATVAERLQRLEQLDTQREARVLAALERAESAERAADKIAQNYESLRAQVEKSLVILISNLATDRDVQRERSTMIASVVDNLCTELGLEAPFGANPWGSIESVTTSRVPRAEFMQPEAQTIDKREEHEHHPQAGSDFRSPTAQSVSIAQSVQPAESPFQHEVDYDVDANLGWGDSHSQMPVEVDASSTSTRFHEAVRAAMTHLATAPVTNSASQESDLFADSKPQQPPQPRPEPQAQPQLSPRPYPHPRPKPEPQPDLESVEREPRGDSVHQQGASASHTPIKANAVITIAKDQEIGSVDIGNRHRVDRYKNALGTKDEVANAANQWRQEEGLLGIFAATHPAGRLPIETARADADATLNREAEASVAVALGTLSAQSAQTASGIKFRQVEHREKASKASARQERRSEAAQRLSDTVRDVERLQHHFHASMHEFVAPPLDSLDESEVKIGPVLTENMMEQNSRQQTVFHGSSGQV